MPDIRVIFYLVLLFLFVVPGPPDEFQLVQFIMMFKGTQFISGGLAMMAAGGTQYFLCIKDHGHTCDKHGPGSSQHVLVGVLDILGSCVLVWIAFRLLDISEKAAGDRQSDPYVGHESGRLPTDEEALRSQGDAADLKNAFTWRCCCRGRRAKGRGGRLRGFLKYDLISFSTCIGLLLLLELHWGSLDPSEGFLHLFRRAWHHANTWQFKSSLYWVRVFYSLLALPFMFFNIPVLQSLLTHTLPTGFNPRGTVVTYMLRPMPDKKRDGPPEEESGHPGNASANAVSDEILLRQVHDSGEAVLATRMLSHRAIT